MYATLIAAALLWGAATGLLVPRAAYRLSVAPGAPWRTACPTGHPLTGPARGWLSPTPCPTCRTQGTHRTRRTAQPVPAGPASTSEPVPTPTPPLIPIPIPIPLPALASALLSGLLAAATGPRPELVAWLAAVPVAVLLASVDLAVHRLPDRLTLPLAAGLAALLGGAALLPGHGGSWPGALLGGLVLGAGYAVLFLLNPSGLGFGDVKLALALGTALGWYGWPVLFAGAFAGFLLGAVYGLTLIALRRANRKSAIPFGPFMLGGALLGLLLGALAAHP
ncbi:prepilin peptidase [Streptomyces sp. NPDC046887]|uniref:prepilin peptidase n=1 Tax=Streptomyces sp. NPDC046887 TaxID=3155472 RepID=UPI0033C875B2